MTKTPYRILRKGALSEEEIADALVADMKLIGITGGTGCGKSTALSVLGEMGALIIDGDRVYHELLQTSTEMLAEINDRFPGTVQDGVLDRRDVIFIDKMIDDDCFCSICAGKGMMEDEIQFFGGE